MNIILALFLNLHRCLIEEACEAGVVGHLILLQILFVDPVQALYVSIPLGFEKRPVKLRDLLSGFEAVARSLLQRISDRS